ncbi:MAG TPA: AMP-binding protein [Candidatus Dormibacteraeota bacterium]|nr:AMP-binding protein [Candidatus Dormibacteraeota bacterium]
MIFLTGGTGFLGTQIARRLMGQTDSRLIVLVQARDAATAERTLRRAYWDWPELNGAAGGRIESVAGDLIKPRFGLEQDVYDRLVQTVTHIIHSAADIRLGAPLAELRPINVGGTAQVIEFARAVQADHGLQRLAHISTAYVAGTLTGIIKEEPPTGEGGFSNFYEQTKYEAELMVHQIRDQLPVSVFRPAMIVGDSTTGAILTFNTFYAPIRRYLMNGERLVPAGSNLRINIIPVDYVADCVARLTFDPAAAGLIFHLTAPHEMLPTAEELLEVVRKWEADTLGVKSPRPVKVPYALGAPLLRLRESPLAALIPYFNERRKFQRDNVDRLIGPYPLDWRVYVPHLLDYAAARGFMHNSHRTVHEQILFRLRSHAGQMAFHDIVDGEITTRDAVAVREEMLEAVGALRAMGVRKGDRVAIVGLNSSRYLVLDVAIGLLGAVSVPLYYTSPPSEIDAILESSGAKLLLVGTPAMLGRLSELGASVPVVSFCRGPLPSSLERYVMEWEDFLSRGASDTEPGEAPVEFGDMATLRYTSGTTGAPKGTVFTHANLRWMAHTVVSLLPWPTRKGDNHYLSFLPLNHVVEGILCTYSAYNLPGKCDIYFLEDFRGLAKALPMVRPTMFFGVPRIYEKAWAQLSANRFGQLLMGLPDGLEQRALREVLLHEMGLARCDQLIVGSAPLGEAMFEAYRKAGIEVHNAYGMTEAPLVALNRRGRNRIGTVGEPLPETEIRIAPDGEILVRGPQVAAGYDDPAIPSPLEDGWLHTGDLGHLSEDGYLVVDGRRKEMIATSYAKKVSPDKVEVLLRAIPGVAEAMLIGDQRPYCTALIWAEDPAPSQDALKAIDEAIGEASKQLAPPERPRRWAILRNDLSIEGGDLTASLKPKRAPIVKRFGSVIDALYAEPARSDGALHVADIEIPVGVGA